jgi:hypothetical protein
VVQELVTGVTRKRDRIEQYIRPSVAHPDYVFATLDSSVLECNLLQCVERLRLSEEARVHVLPGQRGGQMIER